LTESPWALLGQLSEPQPTRGASNKKPDFWQRPLTDSGQTGPDKGQGGKFLVLGPDDPDIKPEGYYVLRLPTNNVWFAHRSLDPDPAKAKALAGALKIYPYSKRENPDSTGHLSPNGRAWTGKQPSGLVYWEGLAKVINQEPALERDRLFLGMLQPLGIEKGKAFQPTDRQKKILIDAALTGEVMARTIGYARRFPGTKVWPSKDSKGNWLDGSKTYHLRVPPNAPVAQFWSFTVYDNETRCFVDSGVQPDRSWVLPNVEELN
jgi:hypothetical protein